MLLKLSVFLFISFLSNVSRSQIDYNFLRHLYNNELKLEHQAYVNQLVLSPDSLAHLKAKLYLQYENGEDFFKEFAICKELFLKDTLACNYASVYFLKVYTNDYRELWFDAIKDGSVSTLSNEMRNIYLSTVSFSEPDTIFIPTELVEDFIAYAKANRKKPILAACFSIVPGLGELYIGNYQSFFVKLISMSIIGFQLVEAAMIQGVNKPLTFINAGFFSVFYTSGIIGAYRDTKQKTNDLKNQYLINASNYYNRLFSFPMY